MANNSNYDKVEVTSVTASTMEIKDIKSAMPQYIRIKWTGAGTCDLGDDKCKAELWFKLRKR
ncbi:MAG: hypothetical protein Unbinned8261contig1001_52 [Prokaryotic dsDNA virus sp.]|nr:MAG: hypothetical protein Unbinned8261contig1001_52 [Prokaryotic dsDNA virus sp.]|tara:strand:+ start:3501 stop:3686 length:186 start_codon:yes stop_codon:yes gene_type:complete